MAVIDVKLCKGCICQDCKKSEHNGAVYSCPLRRCDNCDDDTGVCKLQSCTDFQPYKKCEMDDLRL